MSGLLIGMAKCLACYATWGLVTVCDPVLVSEESAKNSKVLQVVKDATDSLVAGCKILFLSPLLAVAAIKTLKKDEEES